MGNDALDGVQRVAPGRLLERAPQPPRGALVQHLGIPQLVDEQVGERRAPRARPTDPEQAQHGALDGHRAVTIDEGLHTAGGLLRQLARAGHLGGFDEQLRQVSSGVCADPT